MWWRRYLNDQPTAAWQLHDDREVRHWRLDVDQAMRLSSRHPASYNEGRSSWIGVSIMHHLASDYTRLSA
jgi:hypothetical protein